ncbi:Gfo/Idh/MocA family protein [Salipiger mangrovisoli]|uniref:Gfo/Idh/MocA family oxidoreductase n=1 Tax=Salipiger mangrovisoli TaxID=2865933 RepID=A0ABR9XAH4_9RHOB|nr:Gfo/Idh/MocA family oxidoreductase [Salipiger mangrovisoli]MBE9640605.1 Gfo/Idh/MocA family oxidoreductase [Salipiger mangrovisoli]
MTDLIRWGVLGTAGIAVRKVIPGMETAASSVVTAIASRDDQRARQAAQALGIPKHYASYEALLADPEIDAIYNPLPVSLHVDWTIRALQAGKHVLCEKPIALTAEEARRLVDARDATGREVLEAVMVRQHPQWLRVKEILRSGEIGEVSLVQMALTFFNDDPGNIRNIAALGGGALYDIGCYAVFLSRFIFGTEPERAVAMCVTDPDFSTDRLTGGVVDFGAGKMLSFACGTQHSRFQTVQIFGSRGRIEVPVSLNAPQGGETTILVDPSGDNDPDRLRRETIPACDQYGLQAELAARVFQGREAPAYPIEDAVANMAVVDALYRSAKNHTWEKVERT